MNNPVEYNEHLCFKCLQNKDKIHTYTIGYRGYGSMFDSDDTKLQLCDDCNQPELEYYFNEEPIIEEDYIENYQYEEDIKNFINTLPIQGKELFYNTCSNDIFLNPQDWIDIELGIASDEIYKRNNMYSPSEINAYKERFPICERVYKVTYRDGSSHCKCDYGAFGNSNWGTDSNVWDECYYCRKYEKVES